MAVTGSIYTDFQALRRLHTAAEQHAPGAAREAVQQFESLFVGMMLKSARAATPGGGLLDNKSVKLFQGMLDQQVAVDLSRRGSIGLQPLIMRQLGLTAETGTKPGRSTGAFAAPSPAPAGHPLPRAGEGSQITPPLPWGRGGARMLPLTSPHPPLRAAANPPWRPESQLDFVRDLWPHAVAAGRQLGVNPRVLVAQAALETGWGQHVIQRPDGSSSYNLFGIKTGHAWDGEHVNVPTVEYRNGVAVRETAGFRAYSSLDDSFQDYVRLIQGNPRYRQAAQAADPSAYLRALQTAGYATDPHYADKIEAILHGRTMAAGTPEHTHDL